jgi:hypothetical protein
VIEVQERIAVALERIADVLTYALIPEPPPDGEPPCPHPEDSRVLRMGWNGYYCKACDRHIGGPIVRGSNATEGR